MPPAFSISELRCVDMPIGQRLVIETDDGPVEWRRLNRTNLNWLRTHLESELGQTDELPRERAANAFLWHLEAILAGGPRCEVYAAFGEGDHDSVTAYWQEWKDRGNGEFVGLKTTDTETADVAELSAVGWDGTTLG